ncbi:MAG: polysaccharide biosynthesis/export family protein [Gemmatimonas sp.]
MKMAGPAYIRAATVIAFLACQLSPRGAPAQSAPPAGAQRATRAQLESRVAELEAGRNGAGRGAAAAELNATKNRLVLGDFRVGDRFVLTLRQDSVRSDTVSVRDSLRVAVLNLPDFDATGVLRSELEQKVSAHVAKYLRNSTVRVSVLTRIAIVGAVQGPGFYYLAPDRPISDVVATAGGAGVDANLDQVEINRGSAKLLTAKNSKRAVKEGRTLEQLDVQSGDEVRIPKKRKVNWQAIIQLAFVFTSLLFAFLQFVQWYYNRQES